MVPMYKDKQAEEEEEEEEEEEGGGTEPDQIGRWVARQHSGAVGGS